MFILAYLILIATFYYAQQALFVIQPAIGKDEFLNYAINNKGNRDVYGRN